ncbi:MAG: hypothetical protein ACI4A3_01660 [Lachnospiraceae bacterium]
MNRDNLQKLIDNYVENYEMLNDAEHNEIYKWTAVNHFQRHWNLDADGFGEMFKQAMGKSSNIIDNSIVQPSNGIVFLCKQDRETEKAVQEEFRRLLVLDEGNIKVRQDKIDAFIKAINEMLQKVAPGKWKYDQDRRAVIMYLSFIAPDDNFMFKSTEARAFADCYEFGDDIGSGQTFRLDHYYRMCGELVEEIENNEELCSLLEERLQYEAEMDEEKDEPVTEVAGRYNILAYDIMYCAYTYNLYDNIPVRKRAKTGSLEQRRQEREEKISNLTAQRDELNKQLEQIDMQLKDKPFPTLTGAVVKNIRYGEGKVTEQRGKYLTVEFSAGMKNFLLPDAFAKGFLKTEDTNIISCCKEIASLMEEEGRYAREIRLLNSEISRLES